MLYIRHKINKIMEKYIRYNKNKTINIFFTYKTIYN